MMQRPLLLATATMVLFSLPAQAQEGVDPEPTIEDVAMTPLSDFNLSKDEIPEVLLTARQAPYAPPASGDCETLLVEVGNLDAVLGDDYDTAPPPDRGISATGVAQRVVGSFIPFRGLIREISGARAHEAEFREAIAAGLMRRAYLKGRGQELGCPYPASPASPDLVARLRALEQTPQGDADEERASEAVIVAEEGTRFVSRPVVQGAD